MVKPRIIRVINGVSMANGHQGLLLLIKKVANIDIRTLDSNCIVLCINGASDKYKAVVGGGNLVDYFKMPKGRKLMKEAVQYLAKVYGGTGFTYDDACKEALEKVEWNRKLRIPEKLTKTNESFVKTFGMVANKQTFGVKEAQKHE